MARSVSLTAYLALARRSPPASWHPPETPRPEGPVIWLHAAGRDSAAALTALCGLLERVDTTPPSFLLTRADSALPPPRLPENVMEIDIPPENMTAVDSFVTHWRPDLALWSTGHLRPALITAAARRGMRLALVDAEEHALEESRWRLLPDMSRGIVGQFGLAFARTANAGRRLQRLGLPAPRIEVTGPLQPAPRALYHDPEQRTAMATAFGGRPVWLAAMVRPAEVETVLLAHRQASRSAHRLLLILVPDDESDGPAMLAQARAAGWRVAVWSAGELPTETTQILLADTRGDMGLWYRMAPVSFMASSLAEGDMGSDPFEPAALGSAVITGPHTLRHAASYDRLAAVGGARTVRSAPALASAIGRLMAPDQAAAMAHAAWGVATEGAEASDRVIALIEDVLDGGEMRPREDAPAHADLRG